MLIEQVSRFVSAHSSLGELPDLSLCQQHGIVGIVEAFHYETNEHLADQPELPTNRTLLAASALDRKYHTEAAEEHAHAIKRQRFWIDALEARIAHYGGI